MKPIGGVGNFPERMDPAVGVKGTDKVGMYPVNDEE